MGVHRRVVYVQQVACWVIQVCNVGVGAVYALAFQLSALRIRPGLLWPLDWWQCHFSCEVLIDHFRGESRLRLPCGAPVHSIELSDRVLCIVLATFALQLLVLPQVPAQVGTVSVVHAAALLTYVHRAFCVVIIVCTVAGIAHLACQRCIHVLVLRL